MPFRYKKMGICSSHIAYYKGNINKLNYETLRLYEEGKKKFDKVLLIDPSKINYQLNITTKKPIIRMGHQDIADLRYLIIRGTKNYEYEIAILATVLDIHGCKFLDPKDRFTGMRASKLLTTVDRFMNKVGVESYISFNKKDSYLLIDDLYKKKKFPILTKPIEGSKGVGVKVFKCKRDAKSFVQKYYGKSLFRHIALLIQRYIEFNIEYRMIFIDGCCIGSVEKIRPQNEYVANAAKGSRFIKANVPRIEEYVSKHINKLGLFGVDVGIKRDKIYVIETNRAPGWELFEKATGINVARLVIDNVDKR